MPDIWAYCNICQRWFYAGHDASLRAADAPCPVCLHPAVCVSDHSETAAAS